MHINRKTFHKITIIASLFISFQSYAAIQLNNTRVVIPESKNSGTVTAKNVSSDPFVVQSWVEGPNGEMETPFFVTPPLTRLEGNTDLALNIRKVEGSLPDDRESYFWLNVMEIPKEDKNANNTLTLAVRTRIKIFYRPTAIGNPKDIEKSLEWSLIRNGNSCQVGLTNTSPFVINFGEIKINSQIPVFDKGFIALPFSEQLSDIGSCPTNTELDAVIVNDYGAYYTLPTVSLQ